MKMMKRKKNYDFFDEDIFYSYHDVVDGFVPDPWKGIVDRILNLGCVVHYHHHYVCYVLCL